MATATPAMFPIPTVLDSAVERAWKCEIWPSSSGSSCLPSKISNACLKYLNGVNLD